MPVLDDYTKDDEEDKKQKQSPEETLNAGVSSQGFSASGVANVKPSQNSEPEFVGWGRFVSANKDVAANQANTLAKQTQQQVDQVQKQTQEAADKHAREIDTNYQPPDPNKASNPLEPAQTAQIKPDAASNPQGSKSLEEMMGGEAWSKLVSDAAGAQAQAGAVGSETGVQSLIQRQASTPLAQGGAFDAALVNGQGQQQFRNISNSVKDNAYDVNPLPKQTAQGAQFFIGFSTSEAFLKLKLEGFVYQQDNAHGPIGRGK